MSSNTSSTSGLPGRPRSFSTDTALDAALELFWDRGVRATTTRELEAKLGLSQSSIYNAFGTKQALLQSVLDRYEGRISAQLVEPLEAAEEGLEALDRFFVMFGRWIAGDGHRGCMLVNLMAEDGGTDDAITQRTRAYRRRVRRAFKVALKRAERRGELADPEPIEQRASLLMGLILGINVAARGGAPRREINALVRSARQQIAAWRCS